MRANVGGVDRVLRIALGFNLILLAMWWPLDPWGWLGVAPLTSGLFAYCPIYRSLRFSSLNRGN
jgi:hypothetical protein